jgi:long-chain acyl-CoA synthetase
MDTITRLFEIAEYRAAEDKLDAAFVSKYDGEWRPLSNNALVENARELAKALLKKGVKPNDKVAILTDRNINEWHIIDLALLQIGAQSVPIYATISKSEMEYIFKHAEVSVCFVSNSLYKKMASISTSLKHIIPFNTTPKAKSLYDYIKIGKGLENDDELDLIKKSISGDTVATIIYTSGTTAMPKGVVLTHNNIISGAKNAISTIPTEIVLDRTLSLLPVSHIFERLMLYLYQYRGTTIYFAEDIKTVAEDMKVVQPDIMSIVPRLLEKIHDKILEKRDELSGIKKYVFNWALKLGYDYKTDGQNGSRYERKLARARKLVFSKWLDIFGGNLKIIICGGSKLRIDISKVFNAAGITILEGYALTETSGVGTVNAIDFGLNRIGTVGKAQKDIELALAKDGEILLKGPMIMKGYYKDEKKTLETFTSNGFLKTGDLGFIDSNGFLKITGRKKDIFKTSGGKYIAPTKIESLLTKSKFIEQALIIGENERFPAAIIQINFLPFEKKYPELSRRKITMHPEVLQLIKDEIEKANESLGQWEQVKRFELTAEEWTTVAGHLTPTLKVKRDIVRSKYYHLYTKIYHY